MTSDEGAFWDRRYREEGAIWGEQPSPTAMQIAPHLAEGARVLEVGSGYGRDLAFLAERRCRVSGVEISREGHRLARERLDGHGIQPEQLFLGRFEEMAGPEASFDAILSHRMAHLLLTPDAVAAFAAKSYRLLRPGGILALGARNLADLQPTEMVAVNHHVYEYRCRPGHQIRYWDDETFRQVFGEMHTILVLTHTTEPESRTVPVPCHLTIMIARKKTGSGLVPVSRSPVGECTYADSTP